jgi:hypothetical protein
MPFPHHLLDNHADIHVIQVPEFPSVARVHLAFQITHSFR